jgi:hypothetical protein
MRRGLDSKEKLLAFFKAKGHRNLVLRNVDLHDLSKNGRVLLLKLVHQTLGFDVPAGAEDNLKSQLLEWFPLGYVIIPMEKLDGLELADLEHVQVVTYEYKNIRLEKGVPHKVETCEACKGRGKIGARECKECLGEGRIITFLEVSDEETELAEMEVSP